jgi:hypothetical protein
MQKIRLDLDQLEVMSFVTERPWEDDNGVALISGTPCYTRPTLYGTCCTP